MVAAVTLQHIIAACPSPVPILGPIVLRVHHYIGAQHILGLHRQSVVTLGSVGRPVPPQVRNSAALAEFNDYRAKR